MRKHFLHAYSWRTRYQGSHQWIILPCVDSGVEFEAKQRSQHYPGGCRSDTIWHMDVPDHIPSRVRIVDSHTAGEPTRVILSGGPSLGYGAMASRLTLLRSGHDGFRTGVLCEPRGSEIIVGALLCEPLDPANAAGVIFFNDVGYLRMCGHGTIGVVHTLQHLGRIQAGKHCIETPVGLIHTVLHEDGRVSLRNVPSYRYRASVMINVTYYGKITGDIAWGGNWFFLVSDHGQSLHLANRAALLSFTIAIRRALAEQGITGSGGALIDHIELFAAPADAANSSRNFVLCPGASFDRSPCGTGTSAKLACLFADGLLAPGEEWRQEGILGTVFTASLEAHDGARDVGREASANCASIVPTITGRAWITAESELCFFPTDPFATGIAF